jgi:hypothetical protein
MGQGGSKAANLEQIVQIAKSKVAYSPPLGAPNPVGASGRTTDGACDQRSAARRAAIPAACL